MAVRGEHDTRLSHAEALATTLADQGVEGIALTIVDNSGIARVKAIPVSRLVQAADRGVGGPPVFDAFLLDDSISSAGSPVGDLRFHPDLDQLVALAAQPGWAWAPADRTTQDDEPYGGCQRSFARRMVDAGLAAGFQAKMAFEVEWVVDAGSGDELVPVTNGPAYGMARLVDLSDYVRDILVALDAEGVAVEQIHPEYATSQFEVSVSPLPPVQAADRNVLVRQTIRAVSVNHGLRVSFSPAVLPTGVGNGGHLHTSIWREDRNLMSGGDGPHGLSEEGASFIAGILEELPGLLAIGAPSVASYLRLLPGRWAAPFQTWGLENRESGLRLITGSRSAAGAAANIEAKVFDNSANPYLVVGAVLAAGLDGVARRAELPPEVTVDPASLNPDALAAVGGSPLPESLQLALEHLEGSEVLNRALGEELARSFAAVRRDEVALFANSTPHQIAVATRWRH